MCERCSAPPHPCALWVCAFGRPSVLRLTRPLPPLPAPLALGWWGAPTSGGGSGLNGTYNTAARDPNAANSVTMDSRGMTMMPGQPRHSPSGTNKRLQRQDSHRGATTTLGREKHTQCRGGIPPTDKRLQVWVPQPPHERRLVHERLNVELASAVSAQHGDEARSIAITPHR